MIFLTSRIENLKSLMNSKGIENIIITDPKNMQYYSGFCDGEGYVVIGENIRSVVTDSRYTEYAKSVCKGFDVLDITKTKITDLVSEKANLGFEENYVSYAYYKSLKEKIKNLISANDIILKPREVKDEDEINLIKKAAQISDRAFSYVCSILKEGMTEKQIASEIDCFMIKNGARCVSFPTIVAGGERGSLPHAIPTERKIKSGDLVVMDFGCVVGGYSSDMTRTVAIGDVSEDLEKIYHTVLLAQEKALSVIKSSTSGAFCDKAARDIIDKEYKGYFSHSLGHGVGLDIHEAPNLSPKNEKELKENNVVTVEPGIYIPGLCGVRIEDLVVVKKDGIENLTASDRQLIKIN